MMEALQLNVLTFPVSLHLPLPFSTSAPRLQHSASPFAAALQCPLLPFSPAQNEHRQASVNGPHAIANDATAYYRILQLCLEA